jgi:sigma-B regulation protein RsbU (phosphoserine phosphatase)
MADQSGGQLLVADDDRVNRMVLGRYLQQQGHTVAYAENGREALELLRAQTFDMLLLDIEMPEMNGYQVLEQVRLDARLRDVPIIVTSALDELDSVVKCIQMGAEDYLTKPIDQVLLKARIDASLEKKRLRDGQRDLLHRMEAELDFARKIQHSILPAQLPSLPSCDFGAVMIPARAVSGDFYEFVELDENRVVVVVGDVSDKGVPAALFMALTYSLINAEARQTPSPREALIQVNRSLLNMNEAGMFVTVLYGILDRAAREFWYARAGHDQPIVLDANGQSVEIERRTGQMLGILPAPDLDEARIVLPANSTLLIFTDGATEAMDMDGQLFGLDRLRTALQAHRRASAPDICDAIQHEIVDFGQHQPPRDDVTLVAIKLD